MLPPSLAGTRASRYRDRARSPGAARRSRPRCPDTSIRLPASSCCVAAQQHAAAVEHAAAAADGPRRDGSPARRAPAGSRRPRAGARRGAVEADAAGRRLERAAHDDAAGHDADRAAVVAELERAAGVDLDARAGADLHRVARQQQRGGARASRCSSGSAPQRAQLGLVLAPEAMRVASTPPRSMACGRSETATPSGHRDALGVVDARQCAKAARGVEVRGQVQQRVAAVVVATQLHVVAVRVDRERAAQSRPRRRAGRADRGCSALPSVSSWIAPALPVVTLRLVALPETGRRPTRRAPRHAPACSAPRMIEPPLIRVLQPVGSVGDVLTQEPETSMRAPAPSLICPRWPG